MTIPSSPAGSILPESRLGTVEGINSASWGSALKKKIIILCLNVFVIQKVLSPFLKNRITSFGHVISFHKQNFHCHEERTPFNECLGTYHESRKGGGSGAGRIKYCAKVEKGCRSETSIFRVSK